MNYNLLFYEKLRNGNAEPLPSQEHRVGFVSMRLRTNVVIRASGKTPDAFLKKHDNAVSIAEDIRMSIRGLKGMSHDPPKLCLASPPLSCHAHTLTSQVLWA